MQDLLTAVVGSITIALMSMPSAWADGCDGAIGEWNWFTGAIVTLRADHVILYNGKQLGKWDCAGGSVQLHWSTGFRDTVSVNGDHISGRNQQGVAINATRKSGGGGAAAVAAGPVAPIPIAANPGAASRGRHTAGGAALATASSTDSAVYGTEGSHSGPPQGELAEPLPPVSTQTITPNFASTGKFSDARIHQMVAAKDWNGLVAYNTAWTQAGAGNPLPWYYLGDAYGIGLNQPEKAVPNFKKATELKSPWPQAWNALGQVLAGVGKYDESAQAFRQATAQNPGRMRYWNNLAAAYSDGNKNELAHRALLQGEKLAAAGATDVDWYNMGNAFEGTHDAQDRM